MRYLDEHAIRHAESRLGVAIPSPLRSLYFDGDGRYRPDGDWWVVWPIDRLVADTSAAWRDNTLHKPLIAFGDDGTGNPFCVSPADPTHVLRWSWIDAAPESELP